MLHYDVSGSRSDKKKIYFKRIRNFLDF